MVKIPRNTETATRVLAILAVCAAANFAASILIPIAGAFCLALLFRSNVRSLEHHGVPTSVSAVMITLGMAVVMAVGAVALGQTMGNWVSDGPRALEQMERRSSDLKQPIKRLDTAVERLQKLTQIEKEPSEAAGEISEASGTVPQQDKAKEKKEPEESDEGLFDVRAAAEAVVSGSVEFLVGSVICLILTAFLLMEGRRFDGRFLHPGANFGRRRRAIRILREVEHALSRYLLVRTAINVGYGLVLWLIFHLLDLPRAGLWAASAAVLNFIPYVGPFVFAILLSGVSLLTYDTLSKTLLLPAIFVAVNIVEGLILSPLLLGHSHKLSPAVILVAVVIGGWFWGIAGSLMAMPFLLGVVTIWKHPRAGTHSVRPDSAPERRAQGEIRPGRPDDSPANPERFGGSTIATET